MYHLKFYIKKPTFLFYIWDVKTTSVSLTADPSPSVHHCLEETTTHTHITRAQVSNSFAQSCLPHAKKNGPLLQTWSAPSISELRFLIDDWCDAGAEAWVIAGDKMAAQVERVPRLAVGSCGGCNVCLPAGCAALSPRHQPPTVEVLWTASMVSSKQQVTCQDRYRLLLGMRNCWLMLSPQQHQRLSSPPPLPPVPLG